MVDKFESLLFIGKQWLRSLVVDGGEIYILDGHGSISKHVISSVDWASGPFAQKLSLMHNVLSNIDLTVFPKHFLF